MSDFETRRAAEEPLVEFKAEFPGGRKRRILMGLTCGFMVALLVVGAVLFAGMNRRIHRLDHTTITQSAQVRHLQTDLKAVYASLGAAVACLQTVGSLEGLCTKLVK